jgi:hypothetical protein
MIWSLNKSQVTTTEEFERSSVISTQKENKLRKTGTVLVEHEFVLFLKDTKKNISYAILGKQ